MRKVTDVMDFVMDESIAGDECDECDGKNKKSPELKNSSKFKTECNTQSEREKEKKEISEEFSKMPSQPSQELAQSKTEQGVTDSTDTITIGDKVTVNDCPGHWISFTPFKVEAIKGEMVKLEMLGELIEFGRLEKIST